MKKRCSYLSLKRVYCAFSWKTPPSFSFQQKWTDCGEDGKAVYLLTATDLQSFLPSYLLSISLEALWSWCSLFYNIFDYFWKSEAGMWVKDSWGPYPLAGMAIVGKLWVRLSLNWIWCQTGSSLTCEIAFTFKRKCKRNGYSNTS